MSHAPELSSDDIKHGVARKTTLVSVVVNLGLTALQILVGAVAHSQALVADGIHSLSDLIADFVVLIANRASGARPDEDHNYGHNRYETVASLFLGVLLLVVGIGMLWRAGDRLVHLGDMPPVQLLALPVALLALVLKEGLFRYMLREAQRVRSALLVANAWHARSDAASSLVVGFGIVGSLAGVKLLDPIAAAIVGFMVARMGWTFGWDALQDLSDRALDEETTLTIRRLIVDTPGVRGVHELRTRKMGDAAIVDAHILVDPLISVSEGHYIAEQARKRALSDAHVIDALIHVDPETDDDDSPTLRMPPRGEISAWIQADLQRRGWGEADVTLHYLHTGLEIEVVLPAQSETPADALPLDIEALGRRFGARRVRLAHALGADVTPLAGAANGAQG